MSGFLWISVIVAAVVAGWLLRTSVGSRKTSSSEETARPRFKDFRHSGGTFEESQENYRAALREFNRRTGRDWSGDDEDE